MSRRMGYRFLSLALMALTSCSSLPYRPVAPLDYQNLAFNLVDHRDKRASKSCFTVIPDGYEVVPSSLTDLSTGFVIVRSLTSGLYGAFSFLSNQIIVPASYQALKTLPGGSGGVYLLASCLPPSGTGAYTDDTQLCDLYDYRGGQVLSSFLKKTFSLSTSTYTDLEGKTVLLERIQNGTTKILNRVLSNGERATAQDWCWLLAKDGLGFYAPFSSYLTPLGMPAYFGTMKESGWLRVNPVGREGWVDIKIPERKDHCAFFNKALFYQNSDVVASDYDYLENGKGHRLSTYRIALATGEESALAFPYKIKGIHALYDDNHIASYAAVEAYPIQNQKLGSRHLFIIKNDGTIVNDLTNNPLYAIKTAFLDDWHFYEPSSRSIIDSESSTLGKLPIDYSEINYSHVCLDYLKNGHYVYVNFEGKTRLDSSFVSSSIAHSYSGNGWVKDEGGHYYSLNLNDFQAQERTVETGTTIEDLGNGILRLQKDGLYSYQSYSWELVGEAIHPKKRLLTGSGKTLFDEFVTDVLDDNGRYAFRTFYLR